MTSHVRFEYDSRAYLHYKVRIEIISQFKILFFSDSHTDDGNLNIFN